MSDLLRPPSDEGEITDGSMDEDVQPPPTSTSVKRSPIYAPKSPDYAPTKSLLKKAPSPKEKQKHEGKRERGAVDSESSDDERKKKHHHHGHKHHKEKEREREKKKEVSQLEQEDVLRRKLLDNQRKRTNSSEPEKEKKEKKREEKKEEKREEKGDDREKREEKEKKREKEGDKTKIVKRRGSSAGEEEPEMFTIQPKTQIKSRVEFPPARDDREREKREKEGERERMREREKERDRRPAREEVFRGDRRDKYRDRVESQRDRGGSGASRGRNDTSQGRDRSLKRDKDRHEPRGGEARERDRKRDRDVVERRDETEREKKHTKRSKTRSISPRDIKREEKESVDRSPIKEEVEDAGTEDQEPEVVKMETEEQQPTSDSSQQPRRAGYSKFDSESEHDSDHAAHSPEKSPTPLRESTPEEEEDDFDPACVPFDELTEEQKAKLSPDTISRFEKQWQDTLINGLPVYYAGILGCRKVREYDCMNRIEEGTFGVVYRAKDKRTEEIVALKALKMDKEKDGFPITSLREINMLLKAGGCENIVKVREIVLGDNMDKIFLVMDFVEHDMKSLMDTMHHVGKRFSPGHVKTLTWQLLNGIRHMHDLWILHRDLKTSNLLLTHNGVLKIADFGLAREYGDPLLPYTEVVVTLWYRAPELLLMTKLYSTAIDMWSVGCIVAEFVRLKPLFPGRGEQDQLNRIFLELGTPKSDMWPGVEDLAGWKRFTFDTTHQFNQLRKKFDASDVSEEMWKLINGLLTYSPERRMTAEAAMLSRWFKEDPQPIPRDMFPTFPAKSEGGKAPPKVERPGTDEHHKHSSLGGKLDEATKNLLAGLNVSKQHIKPGGFNLKF